LERQRDEKAVADHRSRAFIPVGLLIAVFVVRTAFEDKTLRSDLAGYEEYAQRTRYRLLPGVW
jgi:protein-S-isoprenylcysteine O-methyltransferase Ste14